MDENENPKELWKKIALLQLRLQRAETRQKRAEERAREAEERVANYEPSGHTKDPWGDGKLPVPRMQMHYEQAQGEWDFKCVVSLIYRHRLGHIVVQPLSATRVGGGGMKLYPPDFKLYDPFRDGVHLRSNAVNLKLPCYKVNGDMVQCIDADLSSYYKEDIREPIGEPVFRLKDIKFPPVPFTKAVPGEI